MISLIMKMEIIMIMNGINAIEQKNEESMFEDVRENGMR